MKYIYICSTQSGVTVVPVDTNTGFLSTRARARTRARTTGSSVGFIAADRSLGRTNDSCWER